MSIGKVESGMHRDTPGEATTSQSGIDETGDSLKKEIPHDNPATNSLQMLQLT